MKRVNLDPIVECDACELMRHQIRYEIDAAGKVVLSKLSDNGGIEYLTYTALDIEDALEAADEASEANVLNDSFSLTTGE